MLAATWLMAVILSATGDRLDSQSIDPPREIETAVLEFTPAPEVGRRFVYRVTTTTVNSRDGVERDRQIGQAKIEIEILGADETGVEFIWTNNLGITEETPLDHPQAQINALVQAQPIHIYLDESYRFASVVNWQRVRELYHEIGTRIIDAGIAAEGRAVPEQDRARRLESLLSNWSTREQIEAQVYEDVSLLVDAIGMSADLSAPTQFTTSHVDPVRGLEYENTHTVVGEAGPEPRIMRSYDSGDVDGSPIVEMMIAQDRAAGKDTAELENLDMVLRFQGEAEYVWSPADAWVKSVSLVHHSDTGPVRNTEIKEITLESVTPAP